MACKEHQRYKGYLEPRVDCLECWKLYGRRWRTEYKLIYELLTRVETERATEASKTVGG